MKKLLLAIGACFPLLWAAHAWAAPSYCTGITQTVLDGASVPGSFLLTGTGSSGNCVEAADKIFGAFSVHGAITGAAAPCSPLQCHLRARSLLGFRAVSPNLRPAAS